MLAVNEVNGLPAHILLVHAVVVLLPLAGIALVLSVLWPAARRRLGIVTPLLALVGLVLVPVTTQAGEWLEGRLGGGSPLIEKHANLGDQLLPFAIAMFVIAAAHHAWSFRRNKAAKAAAVEPAPAGAGGGVAVAERTTTAAPATATTADKALAVVFAVLGVASAALTIWMVVRIGDSGAQAVWQGSF